MEGAKKEDEKVVVCFLQPDFIQHVKGQQDPCFDVTAFDDATVFHVRIRDCTSKAKGAECMQNGLEVGVCGSFKVSVKMLGDGESLGDEEKIKSAISESFAEGETGKSQFLLIFGEISNEKEEKEDGIKVCGNILHKDRYNCNNTTVRFGNVQVCYSSDCFITFVLNSYKIIKICYLICLFL